LAHTVTARILAYTFRIRGPDPKFLSSEERIFDLR